MWLIIAKKEIKSAFQNRSFISSSIIIWSLIIIAGIGGLKNYYNITYQHNIAKELFKRELAEKERNPHAAAHFGTYLFKPLTSLSQYDPGVNNYTGSTYRVEAHKQSEMNLANAKDSDGIMRFGELSIALVFQLLIPLMIIFLSFSSISKEREEGTLKLLFSQGISSRSLIWGKIFGNYLVILLTILPFFIFILIRAIFDDDSLSRILLFLSSYVFYFFIITGISVGISYVCKTSGISLLVLLCTWIWICIISPKLVAGIASTKYPLPSYYEFSKLIDKDFYNGIGNDGSYAERRKNFESKVLAQYKVDSVSQLPINMDGLMMQDAEDYNSKIYRLHSRPIEHQLERQKSIFQIAAFITPYLSIHQLSMAFAGTDLYQHQDFHHNAGRYRNGFVRTLNMELARSKSEYGTYDYKVSTAFLKNMQQFNYEQPSAGWVIRKQMNVLLSMGYWLLIIVLFTEISSRKYITQ